MRPLRPGWKRRWPTGYLGPQGQVVVPERASHGWMVVTSFKGSTRTRNAPNLEAAQVRAERDHREMRRQSLPDCLRCGSPTHVIAHTAPGFVGLEQLACTECDWTENP